MSSLPFTELIKINKGRTVIIYYGVAAGFSFYAYILCTSDQAKSIYADYNSQTTIHDLSKYGEVLYMAPGTEPDIRAKTFLADWSQANNGTIINPDSFS